MRTAASLRASQASRRCFATAAVPRVRNLIGGKLSESASTEWTPVTDPATSRVIALVPQSTRAEMDAALASSEAAFKSWREIPVQSRARTIMKFAEAIRANLERVAEVITREQGKTLADSRGDVIRGLEVVEHAGAFPSLMLGETAPALAANIDTFTLRQPLGVTAGICPFNFPAMIPLWMFPLANAAGCSMIVKPTERAPGATMLLAELAHASGVPPGVVNVIHGGVDAVNFLCDAPPVRAISFVGGNKAGEHIFDRGTRNGKRVQANLGAKNHAVVLPDADKEATLNALAGAAFGAAGQRCMALSVVVFVGAARTWLPDLVAKARTFKVGPGHLPDVDIGPMISAEARQRALHLIEQGVVQGARLALDGRAVAVPSGYEAGFFLGPTVLADVTLDNVAYTEEVFAPVLVTLSVDTLEEATALVSSSPYGNGCAIFTGSGAAARKFTHEVDCGQVGVNVPVPVPLPVVSFTGSKRSIRGDINFYGKGAVNFFTQTKTVTTNWRYDPAAAAGGLRGAAVMPTLG